jgi:hypothetical protein
MRHQVPPLTFSTRMKAKTRPRLSSSASPWKPMVLLYALAAMTPPLAFMMVPVGHRTRSCRAPVSQAYSVA